MQEESKRFKSFSGPLNLYKKTKHADTVMGTELILDDFQFDALEYLVAREGEPVTFEELYDAVWKETDGACDRDAARESIKHLLEQVRTAGEDYMKIDCSPEKGYTFKTNWGHNWRSRQPQNEPFVLRSGELIMPRTTMIWGKNLIAGLLAGAGIAAAIVVFIFTTVISDMTPDLQVIEDGRVPLVAFDKVIQDGSGSEEDGLEETEDEADDE